MHEHANKKQETKSQAMANSLSERQTSSESTFQFADNRPEAIAQRKLQESINSSSKVQQLAAYQEMANNSAQVKRLKSYQTIADNNPITNKPVIQTNETEPIQKKIKIGEGEAVGKGFIVPPEWGLEASDTAVYQSLLDDDETTHPFTSIEDFVNNVKAHRILIRGRHGILKAGNSSFGLQHLIARHGEIGDEGYLITKIRKALDWPYDHDIRASTDARGGITIDIPLKYVKKANGDFYLQDLRVALNSQRSVTTAIPMETESTQDDKVRLNI